MCSVCVCVCMCMWCALWCAFIPPQVSHEFVNLLKIGRRVAQQKKIGDIEGLFDNRVRTISLILVNLILVDLLSVDFILVNLILVDLISVHLINRLVD